MKRVVVIIFSLLISVQFCMIAGSSGQNGELPLAVHCDSLSHSEGSFDQSESHFWVNLRKRCYEKRKVASKDSLLISDLCRSMQIKIMNIVDHIRNWLHYLSQPVSSSVNDVSDNPHDNVAISATTDNKNVEVAKQEAIPFPMGVEANQDIPLEQGPYDFVPSVKHEFALEPDVLITQLKDALRDVVNTSIADVREQAKLVSQDVKDSLRDVATTTVSDTRQQVKSVTSEVENLLQRVADIRIGTTQELDLLSATDSSVSEHLAQTKREQEDTVVMPRCEKHALKKSFKVPEQFVDDSDNSSVNFDELLEYQMSKHESVPPAVHSMRTAAFGVQPHVAHAQTYQTQTPYYQPTSFQYQTQQAPQMMPMQQMPVAAQMYQPTQQMSAMAMQMQASAMAMQAQASALMMQNQQQPIPMVPPAVVQPITRNATKQEKIHQCMSCIQQVFREGEDAVHRLLLLIDLEFDLLECLLASNTGQAIDRALQERNAAMRNSLAVVAVAYDNLMDLATTYNNDDTGTRLYHYYVRKSKRATQPVIPKNKKQFLMRIMYVLEHYYEMIEKMQRASSVASLGLS